ncbi:MAG: adenine deaminase [Defluviitaleaceae bacterium]|nr:adenine deaminase [Defluviitaleaceae bacterium]
MTKAELKKRIDIAAGRKVADTVIKNAKVVDVFNGVIIKGDIAFSDDYIAGVGQYSGEVTYDAKGCYAAPGFIDSHIHIESSCVTPEEIGRLLVPYGTTTIVADPHELVNIKGMDGMTYMLNAAEKTALDIKYMLPSCVPATPFEHAGGFIGVEEIKEALKDKRILGLAEFMDYPGVINAKSFALDRLMAACEAGVPIDGHSPQVFDNALNAYAIGGILTDHECTTVEEMKQRIACGMYVLMRQGSACHDLEKLLAGVTQENSHRCLLCSDDRQPKTIFEKGHLDEHLRICISKGIDPIIAIRMATINAAECFGMNDRGAISPGRRADIVLLEDLSQFKAAQVFIKGELVADAGKYLLPVSRQDINIKPSMRISFCVKDFSINKLKLSLKSNKVHTIGLKPDSVITEKGIAQVQLSDDGDFVYDKNVDIVKLAVIERHQNTGNVAVALLQGYGIKAGAVALSIAHDSHNIIATGTTDLDIAFAIETLIAQGGGIVIVKDGSVLETMPLPVGGIMSDQSGEWVDGKLTALHKIAHNELGINNKIEPIMTLCFMSLPVIPELKLTDKGLFDVTKFDFISVEAE